MKNLINNPPNVCSNLITMAGKIFSHGEKRKLKKVKEKSADVNKNNKHEAMRF